MIEKWLESIDAGSALALYQLIKSYCLLIDLLIAKLHALDMKSRYEGMKSLI